MNADLGRYTARLLVAAGLVALALFLWTIIDVLLLAFGAVLLAVLLRTMADWIGRLPGMRDGWSLAGAVLLILALLGVSGWLFGREVSAQIDQLTQLVPQAWEKIRSFLQEHAWGRTVLDQVRDLDAGSMSDGIVGNARSVLTAVLGVVGNTLLVAAGAIYLAAQPGLYRDGLVRLVPKGAEDRTRDALDAAGHGLRQWLKGQLISIWPSSAF